MPALRGEEVVASDRPWDRRVLRRTLCRGVQARREPRISNC
jgi:hypothetical protein